MDCDVARVGSTDYEEDSWMELKTNGDIGAINLEGKNSLLD